MSETIKRRTELVHMGGWQLFQTERGFSLVLETWRAPLEVEISQEQAFRVLAWFQGGERDLQAMSEERHVVENSFGFVMTGDMYLMPPPTKPIVIIHDDGTIELGEHVSLDEASKTFWEHISATAPQVKLKQALAILKEFVERQEQEITAAGPLSYEDLFDKAAELLERGEPR